MEVAGDGVRGTNPTGSGITDGSSLKQVRSSAAPEEEEPSLAGDEGMGMKGHRGQGGEDSALDDVLGTSCYLDS